MRYLLEEKDHPIATDYYYECRKITNDTMPNVPVHSHNFYEIYIYLSGSIELLIDDRYYQVKRGDIIVIPPYTLHKLVPIEPEQEYDRVYLYITEGCLKSFQFNEHSLLHPLVVATQAKRYDFHLTDEEDFDIIYHNMFLMHRSRRNDYYGKEMLNRARICETMTLLGKHILNDMAPKKPLNPDPLVDNILTYINENYQEDLSLDNIANLFYVNKFTLTKQFKKSTEHTVHSYILLKRISMAKQKMIEGVSPSTVYLDVGFKDYSTFFRAFKKIEQITPKEFAAFCAQ